MVLLFISACRQPETQIQVQTGDLLFRQTIDGKLSQAIDQVTQTAAETHFSHVGLAEVDSAGVWVLHAEPEKGTCRVSLDEFLHPAHDSVLVVVYRLKPAWRSSVPEALERANQMLGKPYNFSYILSDSAHYCSEFIYRAFAPDSVFALAPMTFKDPQTGEFPEAWVEHYQKLGIEIPEGLPGCNPNGMAASERLERIGILKDGETEVQKD